MSYIKVAELTLPSDKEAKVSMKQFLSQGDWSASMDFYRSCIMPPEAAEGDEDAALKWKVADTERNIATSRFVLLRVILAWNLTDADDMKIPINDEGLEELRGEDLTFLLEKATHLFQGRPAEAERPFANNSGKRSRATRSSRPAS